MAFITGGKLSKQEGEYETEGTIGRKNNRKQQATIGDTSKQKGSRGMNTSKKNK